MMTPALTTAEPPSLRVIVAFVLAVSLVLFCAAASFTPYVNTHWPCTGDDPHYVIMCVSLARDGDLAVRNNYDREDYREFYKQPIDPHIKEGKNYSLHGIGLPLLATPWYMFLGGRQGVLYFINSLWALLAGLMAGVALKVTRSYLRSLLAVLSIAATVPLGVYAFYIFSDLMQGLFLLASLMFILRGARRCNGWWWIAVGFLMAYFPWVHIKMLPP
ncbi:MAG: hypothetical protein V2A74_00385, partial [bacterium]